MTTLAHSRESVYPEKALGQNYRFDSIDLLRGLVMVIMALDHVRDFFHLTAALQDPMDLNTTYPALYFTRWITHFCAPTFVLLSGMSAFISGSRGKTRGQLAVFLLSRGLWLVLLEVTVITLGWTFDFGYHLIFLQVIWAIGLGLVVLAGLIYLPRPVILAIGLIILLGHNLLDPVQFTTPDSLKYLWAALHVQSFFRLNDHTNLLVAYPVLPWIGLMAVGYYLGGFYLNRVNALTRQKVFLYAGFGAVLLFLALRLPDLYGDRQGFETQRTALQTLYDFLNTSKYPPSLHYLLMTIGPALVALVYFEKAQGFLARKLVTIGRVPFFYYLLHLYLIHTLAVLAAFATGFTRSDFAQDGGFSFMPQGYGFSLPVVYAVWVAVVLILYPACAWYAVYKKRHPEKRFLSYL